MWTAWTLVALLVAGAQLGQANANSSVTPVTCYHGDQTDLTASFPSGSPTCRTRPSEVCVETRNPNWNTSAEILHTRFYCGRCPPDLRAADCRECSRDRCNANFAMELVALMPNLRRCYVSVKKNRVISPTRLFCAGNQSCSTSSKPGHSILVGCESHCGMFSWENCEFCHTDLCNIGGETFNDEKVRTVLSDQTVSVSSPRAGPAALVAALAAAAPLLAVRLLRL
ncbi:hypothetical protein BOX15_Mlig026793g1 [Macrostomum lignano]|uniref:Uncharacterized protein n=1 Tax=Macrostomum lignano TaxID=282301 RepID=A0A267ER13_9PLAT|nr:hypothetical protein BOX15_Mlig026793g1 [Macrostomum lignano]